MSDRKGIMTDERNQLPASLAEKPANLMDNPDRTRSTQDYRQIKQWHIRSLLQIPNQMTGKPRARAQGKTYLAILQLKSPDAPVRGSPGIFRTPKGAE